MNKKLTNSVLTLGLVGLLAGCAGGTTMPVKQTDSSLAKQGYGAAVAQRGGYTDKLFKGMPHDGSNLTTTINHYGCKDLKTGNPCDCSHQFAVKPHVYASQAAQAYRSEIRSNQISGLYSIANGLIIINASNQAQDGKDGKDGKDGTDGQTQCLDGSFAPTPAQCPPVGGNPTIGPGGSNYVPGNVTSGTNVCSGGACTGNQGSNYGNLNTTTGFGAGQGSSYQ